MVTVLVNEGRATDAIYLDLSKAFDTVWHDILVPKLERHDFDGWTTRWIKNWLDGRNQRAVVISSMSKWRPVRSGVPHGLALEPALFNISIGDMTVGLSAPSASLPMTPSGAVNTLEGRAAIQRDLDGLEKWACVNLIKFNKAKCKKHLSYEERLR